MSQTLRNTTNRTNIVEPNRHLLDHLISHETMGVYQRELTKEMNANNMEDQGTVSIPYKMQHNVPVYVKFL